MNNPDVLPVEPTDGAQSGLRAIRYVVTHIVGAGAPVGLTMVLTWSCDVCNTLVRCPGVAEMITTVEDHAYAHHHRGAARVIP